jgi:hypothetical protein
MFCAPGLIFGGTEDVGSDFQVLRSRTHFRRYRRRRVQFCAPRLIFGVLRASCPVLMFFAPGPVFGGTDGVRFRFQIVHSRIYLWAYRGCRVPYSCFALPNSFSWVSTLSGPFFMFCAPRPVFVGTDDVGFRFQVLHSRTHFRRCRGRGVSISYFARTRFLLYRGRRVLFSCFAPLDPFSAVPTVSGSVFGFCDSGLIFGGTEGVVSRFHLLGSRMRFRRYRGCRVSFSYFALPDSFSAVPRVSGRVFKFCAPEPIFDTAEPHCRPKWVRERQT